ncbi:MAG: PAS domain S-box protein [Gemmatimonadetes bacterium]|jgi:PAS domain S-box-containing protein|nr:PAS domain S-box protein [Gemmatimonadota bacterium]
MESRGKTEEAVALRRELLELEQRMAELLQSQTDQQEALFRISRVVEEMERPADLERLVQILDEELRRGGLDFQTLAIHRLMSEQPPVFESYEAREEAGLSHEVKTHELIYRIWKGGETIHRPDMEAGAVDLSPAEYDRLCRRYGMRIRCMLDVPYSVGVLALMSAQAQAFTPFEVQFAEQICQILTVGVSRVEDLESVEASRLALQESEERFRRLADAAFEGIIISEQGRILDVNLQMAEMSGYSAAEMIGMNVFGLIAPEYRELVRERIAANYMEPYELVAVRKDGTLMPVEVQGSSTKHGERTVRVTVVRDISERKKVLEKEIHLERLSALGEMAQGVAHNFNNIMVGMLGYAELIQLKTDDPEIEEDAEHIIKSVDRAKELVQRINRAVKREDEAIVPLQLEAVVKEAIETTRPRWKDQAESRGIAVEVRTNLEVVPPICATRTRLCDMLINLVFNALDALPKGGRIDIGTRLIGELVELRVRDDGVGMDEDTQRRIFEPFFTTKADVGTGLGLSTVYNTVVQWNGSIEVDSALGKGTTVVMRFPAHREGGGEERVAEEESDVAARGRLLIVDDDEIVIDFLGSLLSKEHQVEAVVDGREALERFTRGRYQVALIDLSMPELPGDQVAKRMKREDPDIVTVLITGWELEPDDPRMACFDFVLIKPFSLLNVEVLITRSLALRASRGEGGS